MTLELIKDAIWAVLLAAACAGVYRDLGRAHIIGVLLR